MSAPAKTLPAKSGVTAFCIAMAIPGRAFPAAHPHTEFTMIITVPGRVTAASTSATVLNSFTPSAVSSSRIGAIRNSGYPIVVDLSRKDRKRLPPRHYHTEPT
jgi:hypothetical protein